MTRSRDTADYGSRAGLAQIKPSSVAVGSGSATVADSGLVTFTTAGSVSLNDVFSSTYTNYRIVYEITNCTVDGSLSFRMRTGGADASGANTYLFAGGFYTTSGAAGSYSSSGSTRVDLCDLDGGGSSASVGVYTGVIDLHNPNLSEYSVGNAVISATATDGTYRGHFSNFWHAVESPYTGFSIFHSTTGNITGALSVYGYKK